MARRKRCPIGSHREGTKCVPVEEDNLSERLYPAVRDYVDAYNRNEWDEAKKHRMRIEKIAGKGAMPSYPTLDERHCPRALAKKVSCASKMIRKGQAKQYQANAVCRSKVEDCHYCPTTLSKCR